MKNFIEMMASLNSVEDLRSLIAKAADNCGSFNCSAGLCPYRGDVLECGGCEWVVDPSAGKLTKEEENQAMAIRELVVELEQKEDFLSWDYPSRKHILLKAEAAEATILGYVHDGVLCEGVEEIYFPERRLERLINWELSEEIREVMHHGTSKELKDALEAAVDDGETICIDGAYVVIEGELQRNSAVAFGLDVFSIVYDPMEDSFFNEGVYDSLID